jgi:GNAT superfamily N-acetyltransferase
MSNLNNEPIKIIDLNDENRHLYYVCLEDWADEMKEAGNHKECWYNRMKDKNLGVKFAIDAQGQIGGMIHYLPIEYSIVEGKDLYFIPCIWVHGHKQGRGSFQHRGMGKALLKAAEEDIISRGAKGIVAWGLLLPFWMKASWYKKQGYKKVDRNGIQVLLWKPLTPDAVPPRWVKQQKAPEPVQGKVLVTSFLNGWCPSQNMVHERARRAAAELGEQVIFQSVDTFDRDAFKEWGVSDSVFIDDKALSFGPPLSYEKIKTRIAKKVKKLNP